MAACQQARVPYVIPLRGQLLPWALRQRRLKKQVYLALVGRTYLNEAAALHCTDPIEAEAVAKLGLRAPAFVVPNGVDTASYSPVPQGEEEGSLVFTGTMDYRPNVDAVLWFVREILPQVRAVVPGAHFYVVGQRPHRRLQALAGEPGVTVTGRVEDVRPYIGRASVYVAPIRSIGFAPADALVRSAAELMRMVDFDDGQVLENRLSR